jgi:hypothetical protein
LIYETGTNKKEICEIAKKKKKKRQKTKKRKTKKKRERSSSRAEQREGGIQYSAREEGTK